MSRSCSPSRRPAPAAPTFLAWIVVGQAVGELALARVAPTGEQNVFLAFLIGIVVLVLAASLPVLDVLVTIAVLLAGVGVLGWSAYEALRPRRSPA